MIRRWALHRAAFWSREYLVRVVAQQHLRQDTAISSHADHYASRARRRQRNWENLLVVLGPSS